jgi:hypothetical protein
MPKIRHSFRGIVILARHSHTRQLATATTTAGRVLGATVIRQIGALKGLRYCLRLPQGQRKRSGDLQKGTWQPSESIENNEKPLAQAVGRKPNGKSRLNICG